MNKNYYKLFEEQTEEALNSDVRKKLLLHVCCAPCSSHVLELLSNIFDITVYFYNPNITDNVEYVKRYEELKRFVGSADFTEAVKLEKGEYEPEVFYEMAKGREDLPERGARCYDCYYIRMKRAAEYAVENGFDYFTTSLSISPYKNAGWINEIGESLVKDLPRLKFLYSDFKKKNGYKRSIELSKEYNLYRQDYCGCEFSKRVSSSETEN